MTNLKCDDIRHKMNLLFFSNLKRNTEEEYLEFIFAFIFINRQIV